jgi:hypothetical protein
MIVLGKNECILLYPEMERFMARFFVKVSTCEIVTAHLAVVTGSARDRELAK